MDRIFNGLGFDVMAGEDVADAELGEDGGLLAVCLITFNLYFILRDLLALLAQDVDDVHSRAGGKTHGDEFGGLGAGAAGRRVDDDVVPAIVGSDPLATGALRVCEIDFDVDHMTPKQ